MADENVSRKTPSPSKAGNPPFPQGSNHSSPKTSKSWSEIGSESPSQKETRLALESIEFDPDFDPKDGPDYTSFVGPQSAEARAKFVAQRMKKEKEEIAQEDEMYTEAVDVERESRERWLASSFWINDNNPYESHEALYERRRQLVEQEEASTSHAGEKEFEGRSESKPQGGNDEE
jgi:hypothetical protein